MVMGNVMLIGGISEILIFLMISKLIKNDPIWQNNKGRSIFSYFSLKFIVLPLLILSLLGSIYHEMRDGFGLAEIIRWSWLGVVLLVGFLLSRRSLPIKVARAAE